jgi:hypothetical protein
MSEIDQLADTPVPRHQREQRIAELEVEIEQLLRVEEAVVIATGSPREPGRPAWVVLGVAVKARGARAA